MCEGSQPARTTKLRSSRVRHCFCDKKLNGKHVTRLCSSQHTRFFGCTEQGEVDVSQFSSGNHTNATHGVQDLTALKSARLTCLSSVQETTQTPPHPAPPADSTSMKLHIPLALSMRPASSSRLRWHLVTPFSCRRNSDHWWSSPLI